MNKIFNNTIKSIFLRDNQIFIFSEGKYLEISWKSMSFVEVSKEKYLINLLGRSYLKILNQINDDFSNAQVSINDNLIVVSYFNENKIYIFNSLNGKLSKVIDTNSFFEIYSHCISNQSLWCVIPSMHCIQEFDLNTFEPKRRLGNGNIGDSQGDIFSYPEHISNFKDEIYVSDMGNKRVVEINQKLDCQEYLKFNEIVWSFFKLVNYEVFVLESGLYVKKL